MNQEAERLETAVITRVLERHPVGITVAELTRDLPAQATGDRDESEVQCAVRGLTRAKLLHSGDDGIVSATPAAVHYGELLEG